jgi:hypothetical protein
LVKPTSRFLSNEAGQFPRWPWKQLSEDVIPLAEASLLCCHRSDPSSRPSESLEAKSFLCENSGFRQGTASQAAEKAAFVIPNPRRLRVRDLLFAKKAKDKADSSPVKNRTGFGMTYFRLFPQPVQPCRYGRRINKA